MREQRPHGLPTSGYKGWLPLKFREGKSVDGTVRYSEGWKNVNDGYEHIPEEGHNGEPPYPTGDMPCVRHYASEAFRRNYDQIRWNK